MTQLARFLVGHIASHHSPSRERRELRFAVGDSKTPPAATPDGQQDAQEGVPPRMELPPESPVVPRTEQVSSGIREDIGRITELPSDPTMAAVALETRTRLEAVVGNLSQLSIDGIRVEQHGVLNTPLFRITEYIGGIRDRVLKCIEPVGTNSRHERWKEIQLGVADTLRLEQFISRLEATKVFGASQASDRSHPGVAKILEKGSKGVRGFFDHKSNMVVVNEAHDQAIQEATKKHEVGHAILDAVESFLKPDLFVSISSQQKRAVEARDQLTQDADILKKNPPYTGKTNDQVVDAFAERLLQTRFPRRGAAAAEPLVLEELAAGSTLEKANPDLGSDRRLFDTFAARVLQEPTAVLQNPTGFDVELMALGRNGDVRMQETYGASTGDRRQLTITLLERFARFRAGKPAVDSLGRRQPFENAQELALFAQLDPAFDAHVKAQVKNTAEGIVESGRRSEIFDKLLLKLSLGEDSVREYRAYGDDRVNLLRELLNRFNDFREGRNLETFTSPHELALLRMLDPSLEIPAVAAQETMEVAAREIGENKAERSLLYSDSEGGDGVEDKPAKKGAEAEPKVNANKLVTKLDWLTTDMQDLIGVTEHVTGLMRQKNIPQQHIDEWSLNTETLAGALQAMNGLKRAASLGAQWHKKPRTIDPGDFVSQLLPAAIDRGENPEAYTAFIQMTMAAAPDGDWLPEDSPQMKDLNAAMEDILTQVASKAETVQTHLAKVRKQAQEIDEDLNTEDGGGVRWRLYNLNHFYEAISQVVTSYQKAWSQWSTLRTSELANAFGKATGGVPFGDQAKVTLEMELDHKNDEIKDEYKKHLEHDLADFHHCSQDEHGHLSLLKQNEKDPNKFRAVLEYMASKGWLYDIQALKGTAFDMTIKDKLPPTWPEPRKEQYIRDLEQQNSSGEQSSLEAGKSRVNNYPDIPPMIKVLKDELRRSNYWATFGILERIVEKGKHANSPIWASVMIMEAIEGDHYARKYFPKKLLDKFGNNGLPNGMIHRFFKIDRNDIERFQKNPTMPFKEAGDMAKIIVTVREKIVERQAAAGLPPLDRDELQELTSKVLSSMLVSGKDSKWTMSIYEDIPELNDYREIWKGSTNSITPKEIDDDYYNPGNKGTELVLGSATYYGRILEVTSAGQFESKDKSRMFLEQLLYHYTTLKEAADKGQVPVAVFENYVKSVREKMDATYSTWNQTPAALLTTYRISNTLPSLAGKHILLSLVKYHLLSWPKAEPKPITEGMRSRFKEAGINTGADGALPPDFYDTLPPKLKGAAAPGA